MGIDINGSALLLGCKKRGVQFTETLTIGRQSLHVSPSILQSIFNDFGMPEANAEQILAERNGFAEPFFHFLGAAKVDTLDISSYEQASILHDMNEPVPDAYKFRYTAVVDGGSLEHVFNFPTAIGNCIEMLKPGGHFIGISPANNMLGHGFYQFSPELFYRVFSPVNGFDSCEVFLFNDKPSHAMEQTSELFFVRDSLKVKARVTLRSCHPSYLFVVARKFENKTVFKKTPQQSDYEHLSWLNKTATDHTSTQSSGTLRNVIRALVPKSIRRLRAKVVYFDNPIGQANPGLFRKTKFPDR